MKQPRPSLRETRLAGLAGLLALAVPAHGQTFVDVTTGSGMENVPLSSSNYGTGVCGADFDGDGDIDVVVPGLPGSPIQYFRNDGGMTFTELTTATTGLGIALHPHPVVAADIDNDGDQDILLGNWRTPLQLFINDGSAVFTEEAQTRGLVTQSSVYSLSFGDYDRDGWLDIYVGNRDSAAGTAEDNILYRNVGQGNFVETTLAAGASNYGLTCAAAFFDYNADSWPDIFCANDKGYLYLPNAILRNNGDGTFTDVADPLTAAQEMDSMGIDFVDVFNDGDIDLYVSDTIPDHLFLRWDPATSRFVDDTYTYGLMGSGLGWAVNWWDYDSDGWQDLYVVHKDTPNVLFHNPAAPAAASTVWTENAYALGLGVFGTQYTALIGDLDDDGRIDVLNRYGLHPFFPNSPGVTLHHNQVPGGNWLKIAPRGVVSNRDGLGARIEVTTGTMTQLQHRRNGTGYLSGNDPRVHFGLGTATQADRVKITWPSGQVQFLDDVAGNQTLEVTEPTFVMTAPMTVGGTTTLELDVQGDAGLLYGMVLSFADSPHSQLPDGRFVPLNLDALSSYSIIPGNIFLSNPLNYLDANGHAASALSMPNNPGLVGITLWATAATIEPQGFPFVRTIFPEAVEILIQ